MEKEDSHHSQTSLFFDQERRDQTHKMYQQGCTGSDQSRRLLEVVIVNPHLVGTPTVVSYDGGVHLMERIRIKPIDPTLNGEHSMVEVDF